MNDLRLASALQEPDEPAVYTPYPQRTQVWRRFGTLVVKTRSEPTAPFQASVKRAILEVDKALPLAGAMTLEGRFRRASAQSRFNATAASAFGIAALGLALQGLFALLAFVVAERRREIGVRMALGATCSDILKLVVGAGVRLTALGMALGALSALALQKAVTGLLYEVTPADPVTFFMAALAFATTALLATAVPARRAARTDPMEAMRAD